MKSIPWRNQSFDIITHSYTWNYIRFHTMNTFLGRAVKVWLLFSGEKGTDKISITLQSACCACHVAINNSYFDLMGYLLLMDFKELLQRWIYVLLSEVYRSQEKERHKITYPRSFSKPGVFKWVVSGILPFWFRLQLTGTLWEQPDTALNFN